MAQDPDLRFMILSLYSFRIRKVIMKFKACRKDPAAFFLSKRYRLEDQIFISPELERAFHLIFKMNGTRGRIIGNRVMEDFLKLMATELSRITKLLKKHTPKRYQWFTEIERDFFVHACIASGLIEDDTWAPSVEPRRVCEIKEIRDELSAIHPNSQVEEISRSDSRLFSQGLVDVAVGQLFQKEWESVEVMIGESSVRKKAGRRSRSPVGSQKTNMVTVMKPRAGFESVVIPGEVKSDLIALTREYERRLEQGKKARLLIYFEGPPGTGKTLSAHAIAETLKMQVMRILVAQSRVTHLSNILSYFGPRAIQKQSILLFDEADDLLHGNPFTGVSDSWVKTAFEDFQGIAVFTSNHPIGDAIKRRMTYCVTFKKPGPEARFEAYRQEIESACAEAGIKVLPDDESIKKLANAHALPPGYLAQALMLAISKSPSGELSMEELNRALTQRETHVDLKEGDEERQARVSLEEVKLSGSTGAEVDRFLRFARMIESKRGEASPLLPKGASILFTGAPGTGKTLTAEAIAHSLGRPFKRISPSSILGPYVGQSEQNIRKVFREAEQGNMVLMIDEAEGLFSDRSGAQRSWEVNLANEFLQQVEGFKGILIVASNHSERIDPAFARRFLFKVQFELPDPATRTSLWRIWKESLGLKDEDLESLAQRHELSGGEIRNIAVRAMARGECTLSAIDEECQKEIRGRTGRTSRAIGI
jgi:SpoVK/Ycf46/Vps4 family AAA+-type ATPase